MQKKHLTFPFLSVLQWYETHGRHDLPWRQIYDLPVVDRLYRVWIAEVMLQQTQVDRVTAYYTRFIEKYPTIFDLAKTTFEILFPYYQGLGYYGRARRMITLAQELVTRYDGIFPDNFDTLRQLPGIGDYTAQALLAFGYDQPVLAFDANLDKIFARYYFGSRFLDDTYNKSHLHEALLVDYRSQASREASLSGRNINNALMDLGAWTARGDFWQEKENYPLHDCLWFQSGGKNETPLKKPKIKRKKGLSVVFLHQNHKVYYSSQKNHFEPFFIENTLGDPRHSIQDYFSATYGLEISVRPAFGSGTMTHLHASGAVELFHAQIQTGESRFDTFEKTEKNNWIQSHISLE